PGVPTCREPGTGGGGARGDEAVEDEERDRRVEEEIADPDKDAAHDAKARLRSASGTPSSTSIETASAEATGQSRLMKNSSHSTLPIISVSGPPRRSGTTNSPAAGMKTRREPARMPGRESGSVTEKNARRGGAPRSAAASRSVASSFSSVA